MNQNPNIFSFATKELSQDAVITWLLHWSDSKCKIANELMHQLGRSFLQSLLSKQNIVLTEIENLVVKQQFHKIDVFVSFQMGGKLYGVIIEDKIHAGVHGKQLANYKNKIIKLKLCDVLVPIYFKTGYQVNFLMIIENQYHHYSIKDFLLVLNPIIVSQINNDILTQYHSYLLGKEQHFDEAHLSAENYTVLPLKQWNWWTCAKFFHIYKKHFDAGWGPVPNNREPLLAFWFGGEKFEIMSKNNQMINLGIYMDVIYRNKSVEVAYRLSLEGNAQKTPEIRNQVYNAFLPYLNDKNVESRRPSFTQARETLKLAQITNLDYDIKYEDFVKQLEEYQKIIKVFVANFNKELSPILLQNSLL